MPEVLVDTSVWSLALRRRGAGRLDEAAAELEELILNMNVRIIGPIRQEILSGIRDHRQFESLRLRLRAFPDLDLEEEDYERAAEIFNQCRAMGIQGSNTDFLICAVAERRGLSVFTADQDFHSYQKCARFSLHRARIQ